MNVLKISDILDVDEYSGKYQMLETFIGQRLVITNFQFIEKSGPYKKPTLALEFIDEDEKKRSILTSSINLISQFLDIKKKCPDIDKQFAENKATIVGRLFAKKSFKRWGHFALVDDNDERAKELRNSVVSNVNNGVKSSMFEDIPEEDD